LKNYLIKPKKLKAGDTIGIAAPASSFDKDRLKTGVNVLRNLGFKVKYNNRIFKKSWSKKDFNQQKAQQINELFADKSVKAIMCAKGGYGSGEIIQYLDPKIIRANPKIFIGYSDITALLLYLQKVGEMTVFHGPIIAGEIFPGMHPLTFDYLLKALNSKIAYGEIFMGKAKLSAIKTGKAKGILVGGNLSVLADTIGTSFQIETKNRVLFIEDINETPKEISIYFTKLKKAGLLKNIRGLLIGRMVNCFEKPEDLDKLIKKVFQGQNIPILSGIPCGHTRHSGDLHLTLPLGAVVSLDAGAKKIVIE